MASKTRASAAAVLNGSLSKREFLFRLILAEVIAKPGEGPLAPRFVRSPEAARARSSEEPREVGATEKR